MTVEWRDVEGGVAIAVAARAGARENEIGTVHAGALRVCVTQVPENGKANKAICKLLAKTLGVAASRVSVTAGQTQSRKTVMIQGLSGAAVLARLIPEENENE